MLISSRWDLGTFLLSFFSTIQYFQNCFMRMYTFIELLVFFFYSLYIKNYTKLTPNMLCYYIYRQTCTSSAFCTQINRELAKADKPKKRVLVSLHTPSLHLLAISVGFSYGAISSQRFTDCVAPWAVILEVIYSHWGPFTVCLSLVISFLIISSLCSLTFFFHFAFMLLSASFLPAFLPFLPTLSVVPCILCYGLDLFHLDFLFYFLTHGVGLFMALLRVVCYFAQEELIQWTLPSESISFQKSTLYPRSQHQLKASLVEATGHGIKEERQIDPLECCQTFLSQVQALPREKRIRFENITLQSCFLHLSSQAYTCVSESLHT